MISLAKPIKVVQWPNHNYRIFNVRFEVASGYTSWQRGLGMAMGNYEGLVEILSQIDGVVRISLYGYEVRIEKAEAFEWGEIQLKVLAILEPMNGSALGTSQLEFIKLDYHAEDEHEG